MPSFGFIGPSYVGRNISVDGERCINLIPTLVESGMGASKGSKYNYYGRPGTTVFSTLPGVIRAMWSGNNRLFVVAGGTLYEVLPDGSFTTSTGGGPIASASGPAQIVSNGNQLLVWDGTLAPTGPNVWICPGNQPPVAIISGVGISYMDGYFVVLRPGGADYAGDPYPLNTADQTQFNLSAILDGGTWDPLQFAIGLEAPDALQMVLAPGSPGGGPDELWLMGKKTMRVWYNTGGTSLNPFPFSRVPGAFVNQGLWGKYTALALDNSIFFLGGDDRGIGVVWRLNGYIPQRVSTHAVEFAIQSYAAAGIDTSNAVACSIQIEGHQLYMLTFPGVATWVYDVTEKLWHEWAVGSTYGGLAAFPAMFHATVFNQNLVADLSSGNIYALDGGTYQDAGSPVYWGRTSPHIDQERKGFVDKQLVLDYGGPFSINRTFNLEISDDGGFTFAPAKVATVGPGGLSPNRAAWRRLGSARPNGQNRVYRVSTTDNQQQTWVDAYGDQEPGVGL